MSTAPFLKVRKVRFRPHVLAAFAVAIHRPAAAPRRHRLGVADLPRGLVEGFALHALN
ncbi:MAG: hypothetical protein KDN18_13180 [Verrucomicrobiae bacterium]|nr:hypothetical protein [Verrucomicrobiae bacterium]